jgi:phosphoribosylaminoimidazole carboxylase PurE protein
MRRAPAERGLKVIIAGAGGAAHLPGMAASMTTLPVLGVPVESKSLKGMDSLLSIVQMPAGVPVGTLAIGKAGAINAALLAASILATGDEALGQRLEKHRARPDSIGRRNSGMTLDPGSTIGIIGGGQLGKMLAVAAAQLGYRCHIFAPEEAPCAPMSAPVSLAATMRMPSALGRFAESVDVATYEFENVPADSLEAIAAKLRPGVASLQIGQERALEKEFIESTGARVGPWMRVDSEADALAAEERLGLPIVLKTRRLGYDGKGQAWAKQPGSVLEAWDLIGREPAVAEARVDYECEFSVVLAREVHGGISAWDLPRNLHEAGVLRRSTVPAGDPVEARRTRRCK